MPETKHLKAGKNELPQEEKVSETRTRENLHAAGKAFREKVPRESHAGWKAHTGRWTPSMS